MASPQVENGYTRIANELVEAFASHRIPGESVQLLWAIIRQTYGYNRKESMISYSEFCSLTKLDRRHVARGLKRLSSEHLICKTEDGYSLNKNWEDWGSAKIGTSAQIGTSAKIGNDTSAQIGTLTSAQIGNETPSVSLLEKTNIKTYKERGVNKPPVPKLALPQKRASTIPQDYHLTDKHKDYAIKKGMNPSIIEDEFEGFVITHRKKGNKYSDWFAAWQTWVRNHIKWNLERAQEQPKERNPWACSNCDKISHSMMGGLCPKCVKELKGY